jgi:chaperonin GroEL
VKLIAVVSNFENKSTLLILHTKLQINYKLSGGIACCNSRNGETEMKDKKLRLEDAINATRAAVEEGIVRRRRNSGSFENVVTWAKNNLKEDELIGAMIISRAILAPLRRIAENAGINGAVIVKSSNKI